MKIQYMCLALMTVLSFSRLSCMDQSGSCNKDKIQRGERQQDKGRRSYSSIPLRRIKHNRKLEAMRLDFPPKRHDDLHNTSGKRGAFLRGCNNCNISFNFTADLQSAIEHDDAKNLSIVLNLWRHLNIETIYQRVVNSGSVNCYKMLRKRYKVTLTGNKLCEQERQLSINAIYKGRVSCIIDYLKKLELNIHGNPEKKGKFLELLAKVLVRAHDCNNNDGAMKLLKAFPNFADLLTIDQ